jgi:hypothetical protein
MALYPVINTETGETKEVQMGVNEIMDWYKENPQWKRDWSKGSAQTAELGEWKDKLAKSHPGWNEMLGRMSKVPGSKVEKI